MDYQAKAISEFNSMMHKSDPQTPDADLSPDMIMKRIKIMHEELAELSNAMSAKLEITEIAKELADLEYVLWGTISSYGLMGEFERIFTEVHRSNMSKEYEAGNPKAVKGEHYTPAELSFLVA